MLDPSGSEWLAPPDAREHDMPDTADAERSGITAYEIRIRSELGDEWLDWFGGLRGLSRDQGDTVLAKADAVDGTTDKVVGKCLMCGLGMDGKADCAAGRSGARHA